MSNQDFDVYLARASNLSQRYRDEATDKPGPAIDSAILTASRRAPVPTEVIRPQSWFKRWRVPLSMAVVMMLGVGVTLRTVMQETKSSAPPPMALPPVPAPAKPIENKGAVEAPAGVIMGGAASSSTESAGVAEVKKESGSVIEKEILMDTPAASSQPVAPPVLPQDKAPPSMTLPESSVGAAPKRGIVESRAGNGAPAGDLEKSKSVPLQEQEAMSAPPPAKRDQEPLLRQRESAKPSAPAESEERIVPGIAAPAIEVVPQAFPDGAPHLPEGHRPIVDGKTFRAEKAPGGHYEDSPEAWLRHVAELRRVGRGDEANEELVRFRKHYPDYPAPTEQ